MMKWAAPRPTSSGATRRFHLKVKPLKLEGFSTDEIEKPVTVEMKWNRPKSVFVPFYRSLSSSRRRRYCTSQRFLGKGDQSLEWDDEFENICDFIVSKDGSLGSWDVLFRVLVGESSKSQTKFAVLGKASLNLAEVAATMESEVERKVPIISKVGHGQGHGVVVATEATLSICVSFAEVRDCQDSPGLVQSSTESDKGDAFFKMMMGLTGYKKKKEGKKGRQTDQVSSCESDESGYESIVTGDRSSIAELSSRTELGSTTSSETQLETVRKDGFLSWKRRRLSFRPPRKRGESLTKKSNENKANEEAAAFEFSSGNCECSCNWEVKELFSRDGQSRLKASVFFASIDQRSEEAAGESACTALVAAIAHWLHLNQDFLPTRAEYDRLITQGSSDWRKLCSNEAYLNFFPDKHFDLETVLEAGLQPITVLPEKSFTGFFSPEKFESLKGTMSFDDIWDGINNNADDCLPGIYIVSWNDHFFVLKVEADAYYIIDSLGERLFEGCNQAYMLKFDHSTLMYGKVAKQVVGSEEIAGEEKDSCKDESEEIICRGKECCKEYIKRFLAAIPLGELEVELERGTSSTLCLHQRLQIDFYYSSSSASSSSSSPTTCFTFSSSSEKSETNLNIQTRMFHSPSAPINIRRKILRPDFMLV